jgi:hypothetical protein
MVALHAGFKEECGCRKTSTGKNIIKFLCGGEFDFGDPYKML